MVAELEGQDALVDGESSGVLEFYGIPQLYIQIFHNRVLILYEFDSDALCCFPCNHAPDILIPQDIHTEGMENREEEDMIGYWLAQYVPEGLVEHHHILFDLRLGSAAVTLQLEDLEDSLIVLQQVLGDKQELTDTLRTGLRLDLKENRVDALHSIRVLLAEHRHYLRVHSVFETVH